MSVWASSPSTNSSLCGSEGALISVSVAVDPRKLEWLLEALAELPFPINPQIYHEAALVYTYAGGRKETERTTLVEFPAYASWLPEVRRMLEARGFGSDCLHAADMLEDLHSDARIELAPPGVAYLSRARLRRPHRVFSASQIEGKSG